MSLVSSTIVGYSELDPATVYTQVSWIKVNVNNQTTLAIRPAEASAKENFI